MFQMHHSRCLSMESVPFRNSFTSYLNASGQSLLRHHIHNPPSKFKKLPITLFRMVRAGEHNIYLRSRRHKFTHNRKSFRRKTVKAVNPYIISLYEFRLAYFIQNKVYVIFGVSVFSLNLFFVTGEKQMQVLQFFLHI